MRGKAENACVTDEGNRITPAYAGKSGRGSQKSVSGEDHPRLCGEKPYTAAQRRSDRGSPPPMRGKGGLFRRDN